MAIKKKEEALAAMKKVKAELKKKDLASYLYKLRNEKGIKINYDLFIKINSLTSSLALKGNSALRL